MTKSLRIAAAYIRVSTEDQVEFSPDAQLRELMEYAAAHNLYIDPNHIYKDEGISGRKAEKRPGFMSMIAAAKSKEHPFDVILVHKFDRFARSREDSIVYKSMLKKVKVEVVSIKEPISEGAYAGVMEAIYESFAEAYSINLGQEVRKGMTEKARRGEWQTTPPYGYKLVNKQLVPHEIEAPYLREIFRRFASGEAYLSIARWLNSEGQRTHRNNPFEQRTIEYIVHNPVYIGMTRWTPTERIRRNYDHPDSIRSAGSHPPLIDQATWDACSARAALLKKIYAPKHQPSGKRRHWLVGILRCSECDRTLASVQTYYFRCNGYLKGICLHTQNVRIDKVEKAVTDRLLRDLRSGLSELSYALLPQLPSVPMDSSKKIDSLKKKKDRLTAAYLDGIIPMDEYRTLASSIDADLTAAQAELNAPSVEPSEIISDLAARIEAALSVIIDHQASPEAKHDAMLTIVDKITWNASTQTLHLHYRLSL